MIRRLGTSGQADPHQQWELLEEHGHGRRRSESKAKAKVKGKAKARLIISVFGMNERVGGLHGRAQREHDTFRRTYTKPLCSFAANALEFMMPPPFLTLQGCRLDKRQGLRCNTGNAKMSCRWHMPVIESGYDWNTFVIVRWGWPME
jgi:hypothetical protein